VTRARAPRRRTGSSRGAGPSTTSGCTTRGSRRRTSRPRRTSPTSRPPGTPSARCSPPRDRPGPPQTARPGPAFWLRVPSSAPSAARGFAPTPARFAPTSAVETARGCSNAFADQEERADPGAFCASLCFEVRRGEHLSLPSPTHAFTRPVT
jgi:hypothetical protein